MIPLDFLATPSHENVRALCWIWLALFILLLWQQWRSKRAFGLPIVYAFGLSMIHLVGACAYGFDYYSPNSEYLQQGGFSIKVTHAGMWMSTLGLACFNLGVFICPLFFSKDPEKPKIGFLDPQVTSKLPGTLFLLSLAFFFVIAPITRRIPSVSALGAGGVHFSVVSVFLFCHLAYQRRDYLNFKKWMAGTIGFPLVTVVTMGFMSYGISAAVAVWMLVFRFFRPRWLSVGILVMILFCGLTAFVNWMSYRDYIRKSYVSDRFSKVMTMVENFQVFDPYKQTHLEFLDSRLNQNDFVGKAMFWTGVRRPFADGSTLWVGLTAWIPRIIWPGKPVLGGSGNMVTNYTGQVLSETTSFGVGQVLEFYVNFGTTSVIFGFIIFGAGLAFIDQRAAFYLAHGDYWNLTRWMLPALGMIQPNGSLGEVVSALAANGVLIWLMHQFIFGKYYQLGVWTQNSAPDKRMLRGSKYPRAVGPDSRSHNPRISGR
jgi:hypothetical protein